MANQGQFVGDRSGRGGPLYRMTTYENVPNNQQYHPQSQPLL